MRTGLRSSTAGGAGVASVRALPYVSASATPAALRRPCGPRRSQPNRLRLPMSPRSTRSSYTGRNAHRHQAGAAGPQSSYRVTGPGEHGRPSKLPGHPIRELSMGHPTSRGRQAGRVRELASAAVPTYTGRVGGPAGRYVVQLAGDGGDDAHLQAADGVLSPCDPGRQRVQRGLSVGLSAPVATGVRRRTDVTRWRVSEFQRQPRQAADATTMPRRDR